MAIQISLTSHLHPFYCVEWWVYDDLCIKLDIRMEESHKEKQQFLFKEVIEKNYDPEQFQDYLTAAKEDGDDLQNWPLPELK
jgi:hypothetical protein